MNSAGLPVERLQSPQRSGCLHDLGGVEASLVSGNWGTGRTGSSSFPVRKVHILLGRPYVEVVPTEPRPRSKTATYVQLGAAVDLATTASNADLPFSRHSQMMVVPAVSA